MPPSVLAVVIMALLLAGSAHAKDGDDAEMCGTDGCTPIFAVAALRALAAGEVPPVAPPAVAAFHTVAFSVEERSAREYYLFAYVPSAQLIAANGRGPGELVWFPVGGALARQLRVGAEILTPFRDFGRWPAELKSPGRVGVAPPTVDRDSPRPRAVPWPGAGILVAALIAVLFAGRCRPRAA